MSTTGAAAPLGGAVHNRDIVPRAEPLGPDIVPLLENKLLWDTFSIYEGCANKLKGRYGLLGRLSVLLIGGGAIYAAYRWVVGGQIWYQSLDLPVAIAGIFGLALDLYLRRSKLKLRWLINRFAAERLRSAKFQLYAIATHANSAVELKSEVQAQTEAMIRDIQQEVLLPDGALNGFYPPSALALSFLKAPPASPSDENQRFLSQAIRDYRIWRVNYQHSFASQMGREIASRQRGYDSLADALFVLGAIILIAGLATRFFLEYPILSNWLEATGIAFFVGTAMGNVLSSGASHLANNSRFQQYNRDASRLLHLDPRTAPEFIGLLTEMEKLALRELDDFWRDAWISAYR